MEKQNVLYFTIIPLVSPPNGGVICALNHIFRLSQDSRINLVVVVTGRKEQREFTAMQLDKLGVKHYFIPFRAQGWYSWNKIKKLLKLGISTVSPLIWERESFNQERISKCLVDLCEELSIQVVIVEYLYSVLFFKDFLNLKQKKVYIAQNREAEMYRERLKLQDISEYKSRPILGFISYLRVKRFENKVNQSADQLIAIAEADIPSNLAKSQNAAFIVPYLDPKPVLWSYTESREVFFVGTMWHYPNSLAVKWLLCELAPKLLKLNSNIKIVIAGTGMELEHIPRSWQGENVKLLGVVSQEKIEHLFQTSDMFLCPIENDHGVKIKSLECVSYGTPLYATSSTLKGLPFLLDMPTLDLNKAQEAADYIREALSKKENLEQLSQKILRSASEFAILEKDRWSKTILD